MAVSHEFPYTTPHIGYHYAARHTRGNVQQVLYWSHSLNSGRRRVFTTSLVYLSDLKLTVSDFPLPCLVLLSSFNLKLQMRLGVSAGLNFSHFEARVQGPK